MPAWFRLASIPPPGNFMPDEKKQALVEMPELPSLPDAVRRYPPPRADSVWFGRQYIFWHYLNSVYCCFYDYTHN